MIALVQRRKTNNAQARHARFLNMLPQIRRQARLACRAVSPEAREEFVQEVVANAFCAFDRLASRGRPEIAFPTTLAMFAVRQIRAGRRVGTPISSNDLAWRHAAGLVRLERLNWFDQGDVEWREIVIEDKRATPAETAAARIDLAEWFASLPRRSQRLAQTLAVGETTQNAAKKFRVTPGRISQLRRELEQSWQEFQGEDVA